MPNPIFPIYISWLLWKLRQVKFWIRESTLATCSDNIWPRLKLSSINILSCVGCSLISEIKSSQKEPRGSGIQYTTVNKSPLFYFQYNWQYNLQLVFPSLQCLAYSCCNIKPSHVVYSCGCHSNYSGFHQHVLQDYHLYWFLCNRIVWNNLSISCYWENVLNENSMILY